ncbi:MAG: lipopolysaccharide biosynthesis protein [Ideonella sp. MAG2]|nr:MAG: lipopolysaccharide biosynthesis protein [Ideonella sp. MAG2]
MVDSQQPEMIELDWRELVRALCLRWRFLMCMALVAGALGAAGSYLIAPTFTSTTTFLPPQQQQSSAASALASLGSLASLAGSSAGIKSPAEMYVSLLQSTNVSDRIITEFKLFDAYGVKYWVDARQVLASRVRMSIGKKDGLISVTATDRNPTQAANIANRYVDELRRLTSMLAITEAQQRRLFFEKQLQLTKDRLTAAQVTLQESGFNPGALKTEPKAAADSFARIKTELTAAEIRLQTMRGVLAEGAAEVRQQNNLIDALRSRLNSLESNKAASPGGPDYVTKYREYKYHETLFEMLARQYELARVDESREGLLIQVIDVAKPAEIKSDPKRSLIALGMALLGGLIAVALVIRNDIYRGQGQAKDFNRK